MGLETMAAYELLTKERIEEIKSDAYVLRHKKSGARLFLLSNSDNNKVFSIGFRTTPKDSTGVAHIMEHSVLCGSRKFPLKDPFVELVKGSLNTFLNAMTYPDKTVYPVASCNDTDFQNLMDVYMDAVLYPRIYQTDKFFRQEGWHFELPDKESPITLSGVVYNEMKGALASPDAAMGRYMLNNMFPDNTYANESGGDPDFIPDLTYEDYLNFHKTYYHPSNSYIYLYGDMDMEEKLKWMDEEYLSAFDSIEIDSSIPMQKPFDEVKKLNLTYAAEEGDNDGAFLGLAMTSGSVLDPVENAAMGILDYALMDAPGAPLKQAILDHKLAKDVYGGTESGILQPFFSVVAKNADPERMGEFVELVDSTLAELAEKGLNKRTLKAGLNTAEFKCREADFGYPAGLMYGLQCLDSWLYDDADPARHLKFEGIFKALSEGIENGYFEGLLKKYLLNNKHRIEVVMTPEAGLTERKDNELIELLEKKKAAMTEEEIDAMIAETLELKRFQETEDSPEVLRCLPMLSREDISKTVPGYINEVREEEGGRVLYHDVFTSGITYMRILFDLDGLTNEEIRYASLLRRVLQQLNTKNYSYGALADEIGINCGGLGFSLSSYTNIKDGDNFTATFELGTKTKNGELAFSFDMFKEIIFTSDLTDKKRLKEMLGQIASRLQMNLANRGHSTAVGRAMSHISGQSRFSEQIGGVDFVRFVIQLDNNFDQMSDEITEKLTAIRNKIFKPSRMMVHFTGDKEAYVSLPDLLLSFTKDLQKEYQDDKAPSSDFMMKEMGYPELSLDSEAYKDMPVREGLTTSSPVNYVARVGSFKDEGLAYDARLKILTVILDYDYLWLNLRVKGGAYGCMSGFAKNGDCYLASYRDPNIRKTNAAYEGIPAYVKAFDVDERDMTKYIIGTISNMDSPLTPKMKGERSLAAYMTGTTVEEVQKDRDRILSTNPEDIRALAAHVEAVLKPGYMVTVGNEGMIRRRETSFDRIGSLFPKE